MLIEPIAKYLCQFTRYGDFVLQTFKLAACFLFLMAMTPIASAYIGPGSGISIVGSLFGLLATILLAVGAVLLWPYRRMLKKRLHKQTAESDDGNAEDGFSSDALKTAETEGSEARR